MLRVAVSCVFTRSDLRIRTLVGALALIGLLAPGSAAAHGIRLPFEQWGGFAKPVVRCQREVARAAAQCAADAWAARKSCLAARVAGEACDDVATQTKIEAVRRLALDRVDAACSERQAIALQYLGSFDLQADLINFCRAWDKAVASAVYDRPLAAPPANEVQRRCVAATADAADGLMRMIFRNRRQCMDRIASLPLDDVGRSLLLDRTAHRLDATHAAVTARLAARCSTADFTAVYGRPADEFVDGLAARADCIGGSFYIQSAVLCPDPVCGNFIVEPGEDCDDGNLVGGDRCPADCVAE